MAGNIGLRRLDRDATRTSRLRRLEGDAAITSGLRRTDDEAPRRSGPGRTDDDALPGESEASWGARAPSRGTSHSSGDERILAAAARLFRRQGFAATTVREIAQEAGILPGSLHYRYPTKDDVLVALMERGLEQAMEAVRAAVVNEADPVERLRLGLRAHLRLLLEGGDAVYVLLYDWRSLAPSARDGMVRVRDRYHAFWDGLLYEAVGTGRGRHAIDVELVRNFGFGALNWVATWYEPGSSRTPEQIADAFWGFMALGLLSDRARPPDSDSLFAALMGAPSAPHRRDRSSRKGGRRVRVPASRS